MAVAQLIRAERIEAAAEREALERQRLSTLEAAKELDAARDKVTGAVVDLRREHCEADRAARVLRDRLSSLNALAVATGGKLDMSITPSSYGGSIAADANSPSGSLSVAPQSPSGGSIIAIGASVNSVEVPANVPSEAPLARISPSAPPRGLRTGSRSSSPLQAIGSSQVLRPTDSHATLPSLPSCTPAVPEARSRTCPSLQRCSSWSTVGDMQTQPLPGGEGSRGTSPARLNSVSSGVASPGMSRLPAGITAKRRPRGQSPRTSPRTSPLRPRTASTATPSLTGRQPTQTVKDPHDLVAAASRTAHEALSAVEAIARRSNGNVRANGPFSGAKAAWPVRTNSPGQSHGPGAAVR